MELDARKLNILTRLVESYIRTGEPVGSKAIVDLLDTQVSSATVRNEMAALTEMGYLEQPHTSAGRAPSQKGYRFYIDKLMPHRELSAQQKQRICALLLPAPRDPFECIANAGQALASLTHCACLTTTPTPQFAHIRRIEAVFAGRKTIALILITSAGVVKNKVCRLDFDITHEDVEVLNRFLNEHFVNLPLEQITPALVQTMAAKLSAHSLVLTPVLMSVYELYREVFEGTLVVQGGSNLLSYAQSGAHAYHLMNLFSRREELSHLLEQSPDHVTSVRIGSELGAPELTEASLIVTRYRIGQITGGKIGVIGPTRLDYASMIAHLEYFAGLVGSILENAMDEE